MSVTKFLLLILTGMHMITLGNIVMFNGEWNGIVMAVNNCLFVIALASAISSQKDNKGNAPS